MSIYRELDPMVEHRTQFSFKGKREHTAKFNLPNIAYPNQHTDMKIPDGSRDEVIVLDTVKITFYLDIESTDKARSVANNVDRALVKKRCSCLAQKTLTRSTTQIFMTRTRIFTWAKKSLKRNCFKAYSRQWFKGTSGCKKDTRHGAGTDNLGKCDQKDVW